MTQMTAQVMDTDDFLEHYGVKGMRWGHHKAKPTTADIRDARLRLTNKQVKYAQQDQKIRALKKAGKDTTKAEAKLEELNKDFLRDPDRITASRMTKGEKVALGVLTVAGGPAGVAALGITTAVRGAQTRKIKKQVAAGAKQ